MDQTDPPLPTRTAFFYGTLMAPSVLQRVTGTPTKSTPTMPSPLTIRPARLHDHRRHRVRHADYPALVPQAGGRVNGTVVTGLGDADVWRLDLFEGPEYRRRRVSVRVLGADGEERESVEAETYVWISAAGKLEEGEWDFEEFVRERMHRWAETDEGFAEVEEAVRARGGGGADDPTGGRAVNGDFERMVSEGAKG